jgi:CRISPR-associated endoribonuclease Cas6
MTPDLMAVVITVVPAEPVTMPPHLGRAVYQFWLDYLSQADSRLAQEIHDSQERKPFTCSGVIGGKRVSRSERQYTPDQPAWLRLTGLTPEICQHLQRLVDEPPEKIEIDRRPFTVQAVTAAPDEHEWAGHSRYEALAAPYLLAQIEPSYRVGMYFASPTTFRSQGLSQPVPLPGLVFGSLLDRWNNFSQVQLAAEVRRFAEECVALSQYRLRTRAIPLKEQVIEMGCLGMVRYHLVRRDKFWASMIHLLAAYSFYSGVGYQTTIGLGQARPAASGKADG